MQTATAAASIQFCELGKAVIRTEIAAINTLLNRIDQNFSNACELLLNTKGRIVVLGMGKSGHIGNKIAATLASTGTPAFFIHPAEASHGDMGMVTPKDTALVISNSGETPELLTLLPTLKLLGVPLISVTGANHSTLAQAATINLDISVEQEACPLGLAPTSSTTTSLVLGDALAIALLQARGFTSDDFARFHPGGSLGRRLLLRIHDIMHTGSALPLVKQDCKLAQALMEMTQKSLGMTAIIDDNGQLCGIFTDGDLRRTLDHDHDIRDLNISQVMTRNCVTISKNLLAAEALQLMEKHKITALVVVNEQRQPIGVVHMHDLLRAGIL